ncbi:hypothetical protein PsorP6_009905 [Peronosclerospora sorghi]|uniref:Uncharacterized protein n=1 Tax=Peronosclerospora sorghi TaxID=230839 RepID=A0ACC0W091_9STRA|nr:hypothetical protein PsorP6_009905 [Peronosclerospora sorghi]
MAVTKNRTNYIVTGKRVDSGPVARASTTPSALISFTVKIVVLTRKNHVAYPSSLKEINVRGRNFTSCKRVHASLRQDDYRVACRLSEFPLHKFPMKVKSTRLKNAKKPTVPPSTPDEVERAKRA